MSFGNQKINPVPCTPEQTNQNWAVTQQLITNLQNQFDTFVLDGTSDHKVSADADGAAADEFDYLAPMLYFFGVTPTDQTATMIPVVDSGQVRILWDYGDILGADEAVSSPPVFLMLRSDGILQWSQVGDGVDSFTVIVVAGDPTPKVLHDCFDLNASIVNGADLLVATDTVDTGGQKTEQLFVKVDEIDGYHATELRLLGISGGFSLYSTIATVGAAVAADPTFQSYLSTNYLASKTQKARVRVAIPPATGPLAAQWGTTGKVELQDRTTGALSGAQIFVDNDNIRETSTQTVMFPVNAQVTLDMNFDPPRVLGGSCNAVSWT